MGNKSKTKDEWKAILSSEEFRVLIEKGTERPYTGQFNAQEEVGTYTCKACKTPLFSSVAKFDAGCGWPSFNQAIDKTSVGQILDKTHGMTRLEIVCTNCGGHLGHVFNDGPAPTGLRYCVNSVSLDFEAEKK